MSKKEFKYTAKFESEASFRLGKWKEAKASNDIFGDYSLDALRPLLPEDEEIEDNPDLLYTAFNVAAVNLINKRGHGITTETALKISKYFVDRQINLEHDKYEIVGHAISQGYSTFKDSVLIADEDLSGSNEPFNIALGAVVYKVARDYAAEYIEESAKKGSGYYHAMSTSWEIGFDEYYIALGSRKLSDAEIITDDERIAELSQYLEMEGGDGITPDGTPIYCVITGDARPLGCAFTSSPASQVKGIFVHSPKKKETKRAFGEKEILELIDGQVQASLKKNEEKNNKKDTIDSQTKKQRVNKNSMKIKSVDDITSDFLKEAEASSSVKTFISEELKKQSQDFVEQLQKETEAKEGFETKFSEASDTISSLQEEVQKLKDQAVARDKKEKFKTRMEEIASEFVLSDKQKEAVASDIEEMEDEVFTKWKKNFELFASKKSEQKPEENKNKQEEDIKSLKESQASEANLPNSQKSEEGETDYVSVLSSAITLRK